MVIKMRLALKISSVVLIVVMTASVMFPVSAADPMEVFGHTFGESAWAVEIDANRGSVDGVNLVRDLVDDAGNPASRIDLNETIDNYFLLAWVNELGFQAAFIAHEMWNNTQVGNAGIIPSHVLLEHYTTPSGKEVVISNSFVGLAAYTVNSSEEDWIIDSDDEIYLGYSAVSDGLLERINFRLEEHGVDPLTPWSYEASYSSSNDEKTISIQYNNLLVFAQHAEVEDGVVNGLNWVAAFVLSSLKFTYKLSFVETENGIRADFEVFYDLGEVSLLIVNEEASPAGFASSGTWFSSPIYWPHAHMLTYYVGAAARDRLGWNGHEYGIGVLTVTNVFSEEITIWDDTAIEEEAINDTIQITGDGEQVFETSFEGKDTYTLVNPDTAEEQTYNIETITPNLSSHGGLHRRYFAYQQGFATPFVIAMLRAVTRGAILRGLNDQSELNSIHLDIDHSRYFTFIQFPYWNGGIISHDPTYSAFFASSPLQGAPGFEFGVPILVAIIGAIVVLFSRQRQPK